MEAFLIEFVCHGNILSLELHLFKKFYSCFIFTIIPMLDKISVKFKQRSVIKPESFSFFIQRNKDELGSQT